MAPLNKLPNKFLINVDLLIRNSVKERVFQTTLQIPCCILLQIIGDSVCVSKAEWEAFLQHINVCMVLKTSNDPYIPYSRDVEKEITRCNAAAALEFSQVPNNRKKPKKLTKIMKASLREKEFISWCKLRLHGIGVSQFQQNPKDNKNLMKKVGMTTSEYVTFLKMNANVASVRNTPGRSIDGTQCRHCGTEKEYLAHVLGSCPRGELIRNQRHHSIRERIAKALKLTGLEVAEEVHCIAENGSARRVDIIAFDEKTKDGYIFDQLYALKMVKQTFSHPKLI